MATATTTSILEPAASPSPALAPAARPGLRLAWTLAPPHLLAIAAATFACIAWEPPVDGLAIPFLPLDLLIALAVAQACLLALAAVVAGPAGRTRLAAVAGLGLTLTLAYAACPEYDRDLAAFPPASALLVAAVAIALRRGLGLRLARDAATAPAATVEGLPSSTRGLLLLTLGVALIVAGARELRGFDLSEVPTVVRVGLVGLIIAAPVSAAAMAALGPARARRRGLISLALAVALAGLLAYGIGARDVSTVANILIITAGPTPIVLATLLAARAAGYRLVGPADWASPPIA